MKHPKAVLIDSQDGVLKIRDEDIWKPLLGDPSLPIRGSGDFKDRGLFLNKDYHWVIVEDDMCELVLLKLHKRKGK